MARLTRTAKTNHDNGGDASKFLNFQIQFIFKRVKKDALKEVGELQDLKSKSGGLFLSRMVLQFLMIIGDMVT